MEVSWDIYAHWLLHRIPLICTTLCFFVAIKTENLGSRESESSSNWSFLQRLPGGSGSLPECKKYFLWFGNWLHPNSRVESLAFLHLSPIDLVPGNDLTVQTDLQGLSPWPQEVKGLKFRAEINKDLERKEAVFDLSSQTGQGSLRSGLKKWSSPRGLNLGAENEFLHLDNSSVGRG